MTTLYNLHSDGEAYRITKFLDGEPESSYIVSDRTCQCPAGYRICRHRQMLPLMLSRNLLNAPWFWDFERQRATDFNGQDIPAIEPAKPAKLFGSEGIMSHTYKGVGLSEAAPTKPASWRRL